MKALLIVKDSIRELSCIIAILILSFQLSAQYVEYVEDDPEMITIATNKLSIDIQKDPWAISISDHEGFPILSENPSNLFKFGNDRILKYVSHNKLGYDTIIKRDPPYYHLYDESVIIGESFVFNCLSELNKEIGVTMTFRSHDVFSVWITCPDVIEEVEHQFNSSADEHFFGLGECWDARSLDLKGLSVRLNNSTGTPDQGGYIPFYLSNKGYGILVDNNLSLTFDFQNDDVVKITAPPISNSVDSAGYFKGSSLLYYFYYGPELLDVIDKFTAHVSRPALPPSWALFSTWQWRDTNTESQAYDDANGMRDEAIPCGLIWIDRPWAQGADNMPPPFDWQNDRFPNGSQMFSDFQDMGYKTGVWVARNLYGSFSDSTNYEKLKEDSRNFIERDNCQMYKIDRGNEQSSDPLFTCHAYYEAWDEVLHGDFVTLPRTVANRAQQFVSGKWPGDNDNTFEYPSGLKANIAAMLNLAITGFPFWGADTGGFPDPPGNNVTVRWAQFSAFCAIFETAGTPYNYSEPYKTIYRKYAELYTSLFPYRWTYARLAHEKGYPITRALPLAYPDDTMAFKQKDEFIYGDGILVAPIISAANERDIYLPEGKWYDWWNGTSYEGPLTLEDYPAAQDIIPLFVKEGTIIPRIQAQQSWLDATITPLHFEIYPSHETSFTILGDTITYPGMDEPYTALKTGSIHCSAGEQSIELSFDALQEELIFHVHQELQPISVLLDTMHLQSYLSLDNLASAENGFFHENINGGITHIKISDINENSNRIYLNLPEVNASQSMATQWQFSAYPNPTSEYLNIEFSLGKKNSISLNLYDQQGRMVREFLKNTSLNSGEHSLRYPLSRLSPGVYHLVMDSGKYSAHHKIILK